MTRERVVLLVGIGIATVGPIVMFALPDSSCHGGTLCRQFNHVGGNAYVYASIFAGSKPDDSNGRNSTLELYEDGKPLGPAHRDVQEIVEVGEGRFLYWQSSMKIGLFMSTSDNSDPNNNGRVYTIRDPGALDPYRKLVD